MGKDEITGTVQIDMSQFFEMGDVFHCFKLNKETVARNAQINTFFKIYRVSDDTENTRAKTRSPLMREATSTLIPAAKNLLTVNHFTESQAA